MDRAALETGVLRWYNAFQTVLLRQMPKPAKINPNFADRWTKRQGSLRVILASFLTPPPGTKASSYGSKALLAPVGSMTILSSRGTTSVATEVFSVYRSSFDPTALTVMCVSTRFAEWFLKGNSRTEVAIGQQTLFYTRLRHRSVDSPIIAEVVRAGGTETTLVHIHHLTAQQSNGEAGALLNNGWSNIFYVRDLASTLRALEVYWSNGCWNVNAYPVEDPRRWDADNQVFYHLHDLDSSTIALV